MPAYWNGLGNELGQGLSLLAQQLIGTQNTLQQQADARKQQELDNAYRQQQADEQRRQYDDAARRTRDTQAFQWLGGQQQQLTQILAKGGFVKGSPEYMAAEQALKDTNGLMRRVLGGETLSQEDMDRYDATLANVASITGQGAANLGTRENDLSAETLRGMQTTRQGNEDANARANQLQPFTVARVGMENDILGVNKKYAEPNAQADLAGKNANTAAVITQTALTQQELDKVKATFDTTVGALNSTNEITIKKNAVISGLLQLEGAASRAEFLGRVAAQGDVGTAVLNGLAQDKIISEDERNAANAKAGRVTTAEQTQLAILLDQAQITDNDRQRSDATLQAGIAVFNSDADLRVKTNEAATGLLSLKTASERAAYLEGIAKLGAPGQAIIDGLKDRGVITTQQAAAFKGKASNAQKVENAATTTAEGQAILTDIEVQKVRATLASTINAINATNDATTKRQKVAASLAALEGAGQRAEFLKGIAQLGAGGVAILDGLAQQGTITQKEADGAKQLAVNVQNTSDATTSTAQSAATSAQAQAKVDTALIPSKIAAGQLVPQQAQAQLKAQLLENKFTDATFQARVQAIDLNNATATQQLLALKQNYEQNAAKFPAELDYLKAQIAVQQANAKTAAAQALAADGNGVTDRKSMLQALDGMRKISADERRIAATNLQNTLNRYLPKARFSVDRYDSQKFTALMASQNDLTPEARAEIEAARTAFEVADSKAQDVFTALAQVSSKGRIDPKVAERLGIYTPGENDAQTYIKGPSTPPAKAPKAQNVPAGIVNGQGGTVYSGGGAKAVQSLVPQSEITRQIIMTTDHYLGKIKQQGGYSNPWDNTAGPVRAYNGMRPTLDVQKRYVNDIKATYDAKPWMQAISDATGARKQELQFINAETDRIAKQRGVDPDVMKAIMWNESMGWQPGIPSSDGKGGGLGQVTGYYPPKGSTYSLSGSSRSTYTGPQAQPGAPAPASTPAKPAANQPAKPSAQNVSTLSLGGKALDTSSLAQLKAGYTAALGIPDPKKAQAKMVEVSNVIAAQLSAKLGVKINGYQVAQFLRDNGSRL